MNCKIISITGLVLLTGKSAFATGYVPVVDIDPYISNNKAVKLEVGPTVGDGSWMWLDLDDAIDTSVHTTVTVKFDIRRDTIDGLQQLVFGWVDESDNWLTNGSDTLAGVQDSYGPDQIFPFLWYDYATFHANTDYSDYATLEITWDFEANVAYAYYDGTLVTDADGNTTAAITQEVDFLYGFDISLNTVNTDATYGGEDIVWIDNFQIMGSNIYNSYGFENFTVGSLDGQDGWIASKGDGTAPVPEPATMFLFATGLAGLASSRRKRR